MIYFMKSKSMTGGGENKAMQYLKFNELWLLNQLTKQNIVDEMFKTHVYIKIGDETWSLEKDV